MQKEVVSYQLSDKKKSQEKKKKQKQRENLEKEKQKYYAFYDDVKTFARDNGEW